MCLFEWFGVLTNSKLVVCPIGLILLADFGRSRLEKLLPQLILSKTKCFGTQCILFQWQNNWSSVYESNYKVIVGHLTANWSCAWQTIVFWFQNEFVPSILWCDARSRGRERETIHHWYITLACSQLIWNTFTSAARLFTFLFDICPQNILMNLITL